MPLASRVGALYPYKSASEDVDAKLVAQGRLPCVLMGGKGISTYCFPFLWDAEVGSIDCHEAVIAYVAIETALKVDLCVGVRRMAVR